MNKYRYDINKIFALYTRDKSDKNCLHWLSKSDEQKNTAIEEKNTHKAIINQVYAHQYIAINTVGQVLFPDNKFREWPVCWNSWILFSQIQDPQLAWQCISR